MTGTITVTITAVRGSTPRGVNTQMGVTAHGQTGTIGGGQLEWEALRIARDMLKDGRAKLERTVPLGPDLGQCCGGTVTLSFQAAPVETVPLYCALWIWGAGHVGRALVDVIAPLELCEITWIDTAPDRFPKHLPDLVSPLVAADLPRAAAHAPPTAHHLIQTYSHDYDLALCHALLTRGFASAGVIGSETKWARFRKRLIGLGHSEAEIARIACPIGDKSLGKHPQAIAVGVAAQLLSTGAPNRVSGEKTA